MKKSELQAGINRHYRIEPPLQNYSDDGKLIQSVDDVWIVKSVTDSEVTLSNRASADEITLAYDAFAYFQEDPRAKIRDQADGILVLKVQLYTYRGELLFKTTVAPGRPAPESPPPIRRRSAIETIRESKAAFELAQLRESFARSAQGVAAAQASFDEIGTTINAIATAELGYTNGTEYVLRRFGFRYLFGIAGWWVTIAWEPIASNTLESAFLNVRKWSAHPPWPDVYLTARAHELTVEQYVYGLVTADRSGWMANWDKRPVSVRQIVERIIDDLMANPNFDPAPYFE